MPQFYFDFSNGDGDAADLEGSDHANFAAAEREAIDTLVTMARDSMPTGVFRSLTISILDANRQLLGTYHLSLAVRREASAALYDI